MLKLFSILILVVACGCLDIRYDNYKVYKVVPQSQAQLKAFTELSDPKLRFDFWREPSSVGNPVDIMVQPKQEHHFMDFLQRNQLDGRIMIGNVQKLIDEQRQLARSPRFDFNAYHPLSTINAQLEEFAQQYPATVVIGGVSYEGRNITGLHVSYSASNINRTIVVEGGIHACEWIGPSTVMFLLNTILTSTDPIIRNIAEHYDWYFFPVYNPDGYEYTHTTDRLWRKNRQPYGDCIGADPNRNYDFHWNEGGTDPDPCSMFFAGAYPFSEPESKSMSEFLSTLGSEIYGYLDFHSYAQLLLIPYGHSNEHVENYQELMDIGTKAIESLASRYGTEFKVGNIVDALYVATGITMDWVKYNFGTPLTYVFELRDKGEYGFLLPPDQIIPVGEEILDSFITIFEEVMNRENKI